MNLLSNQGNGPLSAAAIFRDLAPATLRHTCGLFFLGLYLIFSFPTDASAQPRSYPKEIRGYKVERAAVEIRNKETKPSSSRNEKTENRNQDASRTSSQTSSSTSSASAPDSNVDQLITFGSPQVARVTPLGITFEVPVVVAPVKQSGRVDFLLFEEMTVNQHSVQIDEYHRAFDLPNKRPLTLREPLRFYIYLPVVALAAVDEWQNSKATWPLTGRVFVCGKFKRFLFSFKRCVPVELDLTMRNPLRTQ